MNISIKVQYMSVTFILNLYYIIWWITGWENGAVITSFIINVLFGAVKLAFILQVINWTTGLQSSVVLKVLLQKTNILQFC